MKPLKNLFQKPARESNFLLWDIDGVFNPFMASNLRERGFVRYHKDWISWDLDIVNHARWVRELEEISLPIWASNWGSDSNALAGWFFMEETSYPHIDLSVGAGSSNASWKLLAIQHWVENNVPKNGKVVWVDDETHEDAFAWAAAHDNIMIIKPDDKVGLTLEHVESIKSFFS